MYCDIHDIQKSRCVASLKRRYTVPTVANNTIDSCVHTEQACIYSVYSVHDVDHKRE